MKVATPNRVRSIYMDFPRGTQRFPQRGDRITTGKTLYWVLRSHRVKRKNPQARPRISLGVITSTDIDEGLKGRLLRSAIRRDASLLFEIHWYPRKRKAITFEQYLGVRSPL
jgi:hypothetical protein